MKDKVLLTVGCTNFPMYLFIAKYLFTGSFKNRSNAKNIYFNEKFPFL